MASFTAVKSPYFIERLNTNVQPKTQRYHLHCFCGSSSRRAVISGYHQAEKRCEEGSRNRGIFMEIALEVLLDGLQVLQMISPQTHTHTQKQHILTGAVSSQWIILSKHWLMNEWSGLLARKPSSKSQIYILKHPWKTNLQSLLMP